MTTWEYKTVKHEAGRLFGLGKLDVAAFDRLLNELGREGWELVAVFVNNEVLGSSVQVSATFKRPRNGASEG